MTRTTRTLATAALALAAFAAALPAQAQSFVQTRDWDVYVDVPTRFLDASTMRAMFAFPRDMTPVEVEINRLDNQMLVRYYEEEWRKWS